jgi:hypothetical protein
MTQRRKQLGLHNYQCQIKVHDQAGRQKNRLSLDLTRNEAAGVLIIKQTNIEDHVVPPNRLSKGYPPVSATMRAATSTGRRVSFRWGW